MMGRRAGPDLRLFQMRNVVHIAADFPDNEHLDVPTGEPIAPVTRRLLVQVDSTRPSRLFFLTGPAATMQGDSSDDQPLRPSRRRRRIDSQQQQQQHQQQPADERRVRRRTQAPRRARRRQMPQLGRGWSKMYGWARRAHQQGGHPLVINHDGVVVGRPDQVRAVWAWAAREPGAWELDRYLWPRARPEQPLVLAPEDAPHHMHDYREMFMDLPRTNSQRLTDDGLARFREMVETIFPVWPDERDLVVRMLVEWGQIPVDPGVVRALVHPGEFDIRLFELAVRLSNPNPFGNYRDYSETARLWLGILFEQRLLPEMWTEILAKVYSVDLARDLAARCPDQLTSRYSSEPVDPLTFVALCWLHLAYGNAEELIDLLRGPPADWGVLLRSITAKTHDEYILVLFREAPRQLVRASVGAAIQADDALGPRLVALLLRGVL